MTVNDIALEARVIGAACSGGTGAAYLVSALRPEHFGSRPHRAMWSVIRATIGDGEAHIDKIILQSRLTAIGFIPDPVPEQVIATLDTTPMGHDEIAAYVTELRSRSLPRQAVSLLQAINMGAVNGDAPANILGKLEDGVARIIAMYADLPTDADTAAGSQELEQTVDAMMKTTNPTEGVPFLTGLAAVDAHIRFMHQFVIVMGDWSSGKSTLALMTALQTAQYYLACGIDKRVVLVTLEDSPLVSYIRSLAILGDVPHHLIDFGQAAVVKGTGAEEKIERAKSMWRELPLMVTDSVSTPSGICAMLKAAKLAKKPIGLLVMDHIQELQLDQGVVGERNEAFYTGAASSLRRTAGQTGATVICTSQITRAETGEIRTMRARGIEQASQMTLLLKPANERETEITCLKNKFGPRNWKVMVANDLERGRFRAQGTP